MASVGTSSPTRSRRAGMPGRSLMVVRVDDRKRKFRSRSPKLSCPGLEVWGNSAAAVPDVHPPVAKRCTPPGRHERLSRPRRVCHSYFSHDNFSVSTDKGHSSDAGGIIWPTAVPRPPDRLQRPRTERDTVSVTNNFDVTGYVPHVLMNTALIPRNMNGCSTRRTTQSRINER